MDAEKLFPLALGAGVVIAVLLARSGGGGSGTNVTTISTRSSGDDPAVRESIIQAGEIKRARFGAVSDITNSVFNFMGLKRTVEGQETVAGYSAWRDARLSDNQLAGTRAEAGRDISVARIGAERDTTIADTTADRDRAIEREQTRQESIRATASARIAGVQANAQTRMAESQRKGQRDRAIAQSAGAVAGTAIGAYFGMPGVGATVGSFIGGLFS